MPAKRQPVKLYPLPQPHREPKPTLGAKGPKLLARGNPTYRGEELPDYPPHGYNGTKHHPATPLSPSEEREQRKRERERQRERERFPGGGYNFNGGPTKA